MSALLLGFVLVAAGAIVWFIAERAASGHIGPNGLAGIRTRATLASPEAWLAAHVAGLGPTRLAGIVSMVGGGTIAITRPAEGTVAVVGLCAIGVTTALTLLGAYRGHQAAKQVAQ